MSKVTVQSPANIAFIKYWGMKDKNLGLPYNASISMSLSGCQTITTAEIDNSSSRDSIEIQQEGSYVALQKKSAKNLKAYEQIERIRQLTGAKDYLKIRTKNSFPADAGIASSASGFSALTAAALLAYGNKKLFEDTPAFSRLIRLAGSGSAVRSVYGGYVEFLEGDDTTAVARQLAPADHWELTDIIAVVTTDKKDVSSSDGHDRVETSAYFQTRLSELPKRLDATRKAIQTKDFSLLGTCIEADTISMHTVMMTSVPPIYYFQPGTIAVMNAVTQYRREGAECYFSIDAGANVHVICEKKNAEFLEKSLKALPFVQSTIYNEPCAGTHEIEKHIL